MGVLRLVFDNTVKNQEHLNGVTLLAAINYDEEAATKPLISDIGRYSCVPNLFEPCAQTSNLSNQRNLFIFSLLHPAFPVKERQHLL